MRRVVVLSAFSIYGARGTDQKIWSSPLVLLMCSTGNWVSRQQFLPSLYEANKSVGAERASSGCRKACAGIERRSQERVLVKKNMREQEERCAEKNWGKEKPRKLLSWILGDIKCYRCGQKNASQCTVISLQVASWGWQWWERQCRRFSYIWYTFKMVFQDLKVRLLSHSTF